MTEIVHYYNSITKRLYKYKWKFKLIFRNTFIRGFGDEEITTLSMNNYFSIKISNKWFRNLTKFFKGTSLILHLIWQTTCMIYCIEFYSCMKFRVSCIRVLAAIIVVYVFSCINKVFYFFVYVFSCTNKFFIFSCMYFRVPINFLLFRVLFSCFDVKAYFVLSAIFYIQSLKSRQNFLKIKSIISFMDQPKLKNV